MAEQSAAIATDRKLEIFLSHKTEDAEIARDLKTWIAQYYGDNQVEVFLSEDLDFGYGFQKPLHDELAKADMLVLLYTDPFQDWNWCIYESGYFQGAHLRSSKPLIVLHDEKITRPKPLDFLQSVKLSKTNGALHHWLALELPNKETPWQPIASEPLPPDFVPYAVLEERILQGLCGSGAPKVFAKEIKLEVAEAVLRSAPHSRMPDEVKVSGDAPSLSELFKLDFEPDGYAWKDFYPHFDRMSGNTEEWVSSLCNLMRTIAFERSTLSSPGLPLYRSTGDPPRFYRPVVRGFRKIKGLLSYEILFADLPRETTVEPDTQVSWLAQAQTISRMLYWGVLSPLALKLKDLAADRSSEKSAIRKRDAEAKQALGGLFASLVTAYVEANNRGYKREKIRLCLAGDDLSQFDALTKEWDTLREALKVAYDEIDRAPGGLARAQELVHQGLDLNKRAMVIYARRYHECLLQLTDEP